MQTCAWDGALSFLLLLYYTALQRRGLDKESASGGADMSDVHVPISYRSTQTGDKEHAPLEDPVLPAIAAGAGGYVVELFGDAGRLVTQMGALLNSPRILPAARPTGGRWALHRSSATPRCRGRGRARAVQR